MKFHKVLTFHSVFICKKIEIYIFNLKLNTNIMSYLTQKLHNIPLIQSFQFKSFIYGMYPYVIFLITSEFLYKRYNFFVD